MTDLHTHILPGMDDGCRTVEESLQLLALEREQGVDTVYLTSHFYPDREEPADFLRRRAAAYDALRRSLPGTAPELHLGAEVAWFPTLPTCDSLQDLCLGGSGCFLLELPFTPWTGRMLDGLYRMPELTGLVPVLAHVERYRAIQEKSRLRELFSLGLPMQMNTETVLSGRKKDLQLLQKGDWTLASDCHNLTTRPPNLAQAVQKVNIKTGL